MHVLAASAEMRLPELRQLRYFVTVAEELHFGRAASRLNMTQPPLSQSIQALEMVLGAKLFHRHTRRIELTSAGLALLPEAKRLLQQASALSQLVKKAASGNSGHLSLAFVSIADYSILPPTLQAFRRDHCDVRIELREATSDVQLEALEKGELDAGFMIPPIPEKLLSALEYRKVLSEPLILATPKNFLPDQPSCQLAHCVGMPLILFPRKIAPALHDTILGCFHSSGITPEIGQEAIQMQTIIGLVSAGMGIALVPQSVSNLQRPGVTYHNLSGEVPMVEIGIAWRKDNPSAVLQAFLHLLEN